MTQIEIMKDYLKIEEKPETIDLRRIISIVEMMNFAAQFRRKIIVSTGSSIPINAITFIIAPSGVGKDSGIKLTRERYRLGYDIIENNRRAAATAKAIEDARRNGVAHPELEKFFSKYYKEPPSLFIGVSTNEGIIAQINEMSEESVGSLSIYNGEFATEFSNHSSNITSNIQLISEMYDMGDKEIKRIKDQNSQSKIVKGFAVNTTYATSQDNMIANRIALDRFKTEMLSKLARRSFIYYEKKEKIEDEEIDNPKEFLDSIIKKYADKAEIEKALHTEASNIAENIAITNMQKLGQDITIDDEAQKLISVYNEYGIALAENEISNEFPITRISQAHAYWRAIKLAGAIAIYQCEDSISAGTYREAMNVVQSLIPFVTKLEKELNKQNYELLIDMLHDTPKAKIYLLQKKGILPKASKNEIEDLILIANSADNTGVYKYDITEKAIIYSPYAIKTSSPYKVSFLKLEGISKEDRAVRCANGFKTFNVPSFEKLGDVLKADCAFSPFEYKDGKRSDETTIRIAKWICLDIDKNDFPDSYVHKMLSEYKIRHIMARTSDPNINTKFRLILELDRTIDFTNINYPKFIQAIANDLPGIKLADQLPPSQMYYGYVNRELLKYLAEDSKPIETQPYINYARINISNKVLREEDMIKSLEDLRRASKHILDSKPEETLFMKSMQAKEGNRSTTAIAALKQAVGYGYDKDQLKALINKLNEHWNPPMDSYEVAKFHKQIDKDYDKWLRKAIQNMNERMPHE